jgi:hypothetical protein
MHSNLVSIRLDLPGAHSCELRTRSGTALQIPNPLRSATPSHANCCTTRWIRLTEFGQPTRIDTFYNAFKFGIRLTRFARCAFVRIPNPPPQTFRTSIAIQPRAFTSRNLPCPLGSASSTTHSNSVFVRLRLPAAHSLRILVCYPAEFSRPTLLNSRALPRRIFASYPAEFPHMNPLNFRA